MGLCTSYIGVEEQVDIDESHDWSCSPSGSFCTIDLLHLGADKVDIPFIVNG